jgi:hypothetical protein
VLVFAEVALMAVTFVTEPEATGATTLEMAPAVEGAALDAAALLAVALCPRQ